MREDQRANARTAIDGDAVPFLSAHRFTDSGLAKHAEWLRTWDLQRREDAGETVGAIPVPPKYDQKGYRDAASWRLRGKVDVSKERFIGYPGYASDDDGEPLYGWAGWNHLQQALAAPYHDRKDREGWAKERLVPMLAGILELLPWIKQWHNAPSADLDGLRLGDSFEGLLEGQMRELGVTVDELRAFRPAKTGRAGRPAARATRTEDGAADESRAASVDEATKIDGRAGEEVRVAGQSGAQESDRVMRGRAVVTRHRLVRARAASHHAQCLLPIAISTNSSAFIASLRF